MAVLKVAVDTVKAAASGFVVVDVGEAVEQEALLLGVEGGEGFGLGVDEGELGCERWRRTATVAGWLLMKTRPLSGGGNFATEEDFRVPSWIDAVGFEDFFRAGRGFENAAEDCFFRAEADNVGRSLAAEQQDEGVDEDGFACAGFACEQVEARAELGDGVVDDGVVFGAEFEEHRESLALENIRRGEGKAEVLAVERARMEVLAVHAAMGGLSTAQCARCAHCFAQR